MKSKQLAMVIGDQRQSGQIVERDLERSGPQQTLSCGNCHFLLSAERTLFVSEAEYRLLPKIRTRTLFPSCGMFRVVIVQSQPLAWSHILLGTEKADNNGNCRRMLLTDNL